MRAQFVLITVLWLLHILYVSPLGVELDLFNEEVKSNGQFERKYNGVMISVCQSAMKFREKLECCLRREASNY